MSTELNPGTKTENAVYAGFGIALGLMIFRIYMPSVFLDIKGLVAAVLLSASIIGALFFYGRPERLLIWAFRKHILKRTIKEMSSFLIRIRASYKVWYRSINENWLTIEEECDNALDSAMKGRDLYDDMWRLKGGIYFSLGIIPLLISITLPVPTMQIATLPLEVSVQLFVITEIIVIVAMVIDFWSFPSKCSKVAMFRMLQDVHSVVIQQMPLTPVSRNPEYILETIPISALVPPEMTIPGIGQTLERALDETDFIISRHEWKRFVPRFKFLVGDTRFESPDVFAEIERYFLQTLITYYLEFLVLDSSRSFIRHVLQIWSVPEKRVKFFEKQLWLQIEVLEEFESYFMSKLKLSKRKLLHFFKIKEGINHSLIFDIGKTLTNRSEILHFCNQIVDVLWLVAVKVPDSIEYEEIEIVLDWYKMRQISNVAPLVKIAAKFVYQDTLIRQGNGEAVSQHEIAQDIVNTIKKHEFSSIWTDLSPNLLKWVTEQNDPDFDTIVGYAPFVHDPDQLIPLIKKNAMTHDKFLFWLIIAYHDFLQQGIVPSWLLQGISELLEEMSNPSDLLMRIVDFMNHKNPDAVNGALHLLDDLSALDTKLIQKNAKTILNIVSALLMRIDQSTEMFSIETQILASDFAARLESWI